jgi:ATP-dependent HslUV protease ATP-binding subunit HslU
VNVVFDGASQAVEEMAQVAAELNEEDNIGARRLRTVLDAVLEDINYEAPDFEHKDSL